MTVVSLLPDNSTPYERAISLAAAEQPRLPVELLATLHDPMTCPAHLLPYLAWALSVDVWKDDWPESKKRAVVAAAPGLHRLKGTKPGLRKHLEIVGARLVNLRQPPDKFFAGPDLTKAEYEQFLSRFRQLRVYAFRSRGSFGGQAHLTDRRLFPDGDFFCGLSDAATRIGRRAFLFDPLTGEERPIVTAQRERITETREAVRFEAFALPGVARGLFAGMPADRAFLADSGAADRLYAMQIRQSYDHVSERLHLSAVAPALTPVDVRPRRVAERGTVRFGQLFPGGSAGRSHLGEIYLPAGTAHLRLYDRVHLYERDRSTTYAGGRPARAFLDAGQHLGLPAHHLVARIEVRGRQPRDAFDRFARGFLRESGHEARADALTAAHVSKAAYERLLVSTRTMRPAAVGDRVKLGSIRVGQWIKV